MYVPNMIEIPTHEADLKHHGVGFEGRSKNQQWSHHEVEREHRKKVKRKKEKERG
jgi:hypothetical protein